jgi:hypothetical protein
VCSCAHGEGKTPLRIIPDRNCEQLSFFLRLCALKYCRSVRLIFLLVLNPNPPFRKNDNCSQFLSGIIRKGVFPSPCALLHTVSLTAGMIKDRDFVSNITNHDEGYRVLRNVRGSPAAWQKMQYDCLAKLRQLGPYTFFMTFSVADFKWNSIIKVIGRFLQVLVCLWVFSYVTNLCKSFCVSSSGKLHDTYLSTN